MSDSTVAVNRKARFTYHILEQFDAGIVLEGHEVKFVRSKDVSMQESFIRCS